ncbi:HlyD family efflux transporter periplasmic adaptor subunit [Phyllobacterium sp. SYP-B3895]|uniref:HlyD family secretion protein n=1 Tax=Phyllobacterium pellucidum TaxID=2740464 RepID=A0A849VRS3_9HYPH|nr:MULTISPECIES: HlyD family secretion protein [Phyllobacterium]MRG54048.1 HlyD family efflux transporter periplasmic adaptor subunit [Phyllobacterium sp. SYP-B3895]NTS30747.1 HlyD family secretion protein [Phyllobacterium pellucidum]UGY10634.1 HlyD family secretion protein [Phyllobacterium sp. T1018]
MADGSPSMRIPANSDQAPAPSQRSETVLEKRDTTIETPAIPVTKEAPPAPARPRRSLKRPLLFAVLPLALIVGGYFYVTGGQVMSTDNAYVQADMVGVSTDVSGMVQSIEVHDNQVVKQGDVLFRLDPSAYEIALAGAKAQLGVVRNQILNLEASYKQSLAEITQAEADIPFYNKTLQRQQDLTATAAVSKAAYDQAKHDLDAAQQKVDVAKAEAAATLAQLGNDPNQPVEQNPSYLQAQSAVDNAQRNLDRTIVRAPFDGIVTNVSALQVGAYLQASQAGFSLVSTTHMWVAASPKETELTYVREGQPVTISVDTYPGVEWKGKVASISPASGSSFSLLPAQNTSGNWVKVVQRIPMLVSIDDLSGKPPLRVGMSVTADVETGHARGMPKFISDLFGGFGSKSHG